MNEHDVTKLPRWAQSKIDVLERNVEYFKNKAIELKLPTDTGQHISYAAQGKKQIRYMPDGTQIEYYLPNGTISVKNVGDRLDVFYEMDNGLTQLAAIPRSGNHLNLALVDRD